MNVTITYNKEVPVELLAAGNYTESREVEIELLTETGDTTNPKTSDQIGYTFVILGISLLLIAILIKVEKVRKVMVIDLAVSIVIPCVVKAIEKLNITVNAKIEVAGTKKFCIRNEDVETLYDFKDTMTWQDYQNSEFEPISEYPNMFSYNEYETCANDILTNENNINDVLSTVVDDNPIDCAGYQAVRSTDRIMDSSLGCYEYGK